MKPSTTNKFDQHFFKALFFRVIYIFWYYFDTYYKHLRVRQLAQGSLRHILRRRSGLKFRTFQLGANNSSPYTTLSLFYSVVAVSFPFCSIVIFPSYRRSKDSNSSYSKAALCSNCCDSCNFRGGNKK